MTPPNRRPQAAAQMRRLRAKRRNAGLCAYCGTASVTYYCREHTTYKVQSNRDARRQARETVSR